MLYLVATPIGNLDDITIRALQVLKAVDVIASEDTRKTGRLLKHFDITARQFAYHEHNEHRVQQRLIGMLKDGQSVAVVTDAGTPGIADPGFTLVRAAVADNIPVSAIPGASACVVAVVLSGLPVHSFTFRGFSPRKSGQRKRFIAVDKLSPHTLVFYESPYRLVGFLSDAQEVLGDRRAAIANDLTKMHECVWRGTLGELSTTVSAARLKGEFVVVIEGRRGEEPSPSIE